jgi:hypothetical protein
MLFIDLSILNILIELTKFPELLVPLVMASQSGNMKMLGIAIGCLHRLVTYNAFSTVSLRG